MTLTLIAAIALAPTCQDWSRFRGPDGAGVRRDAELPSELDASHVRWRVPSGEGHSSPVVHDGRVFLTREGEEGTRSIVAFRATDGEELWSHEVSFEPIKIHRLNSHAASTPAVDDTGVYVAWIHGGRAIAQALDTNGEPRWSRDLGPFAAQHGGGNSPVLFGDLVVIANEHEGEDSCLVALDKATGEPRWSIPRTTRERRGSYACPIPWTPKGGEPLLLFASTAHGLTAVDAAKGEVAWELDLGFGQRFVGLPAIANGHAILTAGSGGGGKEGAVVRLPRGDDEEASIAYSPRRNLPYVPANLGIGDHFFLVSDGGIASCLEAKSGEALWSERLDGTFFSSPVSDGDVVWIGSREGRLMSFAAGPEFRAYAPLDLGAPILATPALTRDRIYVRTESELVCLGVDVKANRR